MQEILAAFKGYTNRIRRSPLFSIHKEPVLVLFDDGSGHIQSADMETRYLDFSDINDLLAKLKTDTQNP